MQGVIIKSICGQMISTPYLGIFAETGIWPVLQLLEYKQLLLLHNIINTQQERLITEIVKEQINNPYEGCWMENVNKTLQKYEINKIKTALNNKISKN